MKPLNLSPLVGKRIRVERGLSESRDGRLLAVKDDHIVLQTDEGISFYKLHYINMIPLDSKAHSDILPSDNSDAVLPAQRDPNTFHDVLQQMKYRWVRINGEGPENMQGVLVEVNDDHILLIYRDMIVKIFNLHIRNISCGSPGQSFDGNNDGHANDDNNDNNKTETEINKNIQKKKENDSEKSRNEKKRKKNKTNPSKRS